MIEVRISYKVKRDLEEAKFASKYNFQENSTFCSFLTFLDNLRL